MCFRAAIRHANRTLQLIALLSIGALAAITALAVFGGPDERAIEAAFDMLDEAGRTFEAERALRLPLGEPMVGDAMDDYHWRCNHRHPRPLPISPDKLARLTPEERAALDAPIERAVVDRFVRGQRREDVGSGSVLFQCASSIGSRSKAVLAAAVVAADRGDIDLAWRRAIAVVRYADDVVGRSSLILSLLANARATAAVALMTDLAELASDDQARRWRSELALLQASALDPERLDVALAVGEGAAIRELKAEFEDQWNETVEQDLERMVRAATGDGSDIGVWCEEVGGDPLCNMRQSLTQDVTVVAAGLDSVDCILARGRDPRCEGLASRL